MTNVVGEDCDLRKPSIMEWTTYFAPGFRGGGPTKSVSELLAYLGDLRMNVVTGDRDLGEPVPYSSVALDHWLSQSSSRIWYRSRGLRGMMRLLRAVRAVDPDVHHLNSLWSPDFSLLPLVAMRCGILPKRPILLSPRGEFAVAALRKSAGRKSLVRPLLRHLVLPGLDVTWHATSSSEAKQIRRWVGADARVDIIQNLAGSTGGESAHRWAPRPSGAPLRCVSLTRIARNKNLLTAIRTVLALEGAACLDIIGPPEDAAYVHECEAAAAHAEGLVRFLPAVGPSDVSATLSKYDVMVFPTFNENFGHVIAEALAVGTPVVTSNETPWTDLLGRLGLAVAAPTDVDAHVAQLVRLADLSNADQTALRHHVLEERLEWARHLHVTVDDYRRLFTRLASERG